DWAGCTGWSRAWSPGPALGAWPGRSPRRSGGRRPARSPAAAEPAPHETFSQPGSAPEPSILGCSLDVGGWAVSGRPLALRPRLATGLPFTTDPSSADLKGTFSPWTNVLAVFLGR